MTRPRPSRIDYGKYPGEVYAIDETARVRFRAKPTQVPSNQFGVAVLTPYNPWGIEPVSIRRPERLRKAEEEFRRKLQELTPPIQDRGIGWWYER